MATDHDFKPLYDDIQVSRISAEKIGWPKDGVETLAELKEILAGKEVLIKEQFTCSDFDKVIEVMVRESPEVKAPTTSFQRIN